MCEAISGATAAYALIATAISTAVTMKGQQVQGETQQKIAEYNAAGKRQQSEAILADSKIAEQEHRDRVRQIQGSQLAKMGATGLDPTAAGTMQDVLAETSSMGAVDEQRIKLNAQRQAWGLDTAASNDILEGSAAAAAGRNAATGTLITGAARAYGQYRDYGGWQQKTPKTIYQPQKQ